MKKYLIVFLINIIILVLGVFLSFSNEKIDIRVLENICYKPIINAYHFEAEEAQDIQNKYQSCFNNTFIDDTLVENMSALQSSIDINTTTIRMDSKDNFLSIKTTFTYDTEDTIDTYTMTAYKYRGNHIPYDILALLIIVLFNTLVYLFDKNYQKKYEMNTLFNATGSAVVIAFIITNSFSFSVPVYYYLSGMYILVHVIHIYSIYFTKNVVFHLKIEESEVDTLYDSLNKLHVDLKLFKRVNFSGNYYTVRINKDQVDGFEKLMDEIIPLNKRLYFYINLVLVSLINFVAIGYLINYFLQ